MQLFFRTWFFLSAFLLYPLFGHSNDFDSKIITDQLDRPWSLAFLPDGDFLVTEKTGQLRRVSAQGDISTPIEGLPNIAVTGQGGLLDVVLHPDFSANQSIYLSYVSGSSKNGYSTEVIKATLQDNKLVDLQNIFVALPKIRGGRHFGSRLVFDNDNYLYISLGDRGKRELAQQLDSHHGSLIRLHDDGRVPADNPFVNAPDALAEIFSYGHRNIQGLALHPGTGEVWAHEHGPKGGDELNRIVAGANYGWPVITYGVNYGLGTKIGEGTQKEGMQQPQHYWDPSIAPSGLAFHPDISAGKDLNEITGMWYVGALKFKLLAQLTPSANNTFTEKRYLEKQFGRIRDVRIKGNTLYLLTDADEGKLIQLQLDNRQ